MNTTNLRIGGAAIAILAVIAWLFMSAGTPMPVADPAMTAAAFLAEIRSGKADLAWEGTGSEFKSFMGRDQFRQFVKNHAGLRIAAVAGESVATGPLRECSFTCGTLKVVVIVGPVDGHWKVEGIRAG